MANSNKKFVALSPNGQVYMKYKKELIEFREDEKPMQNVFSSEEIKKFNNIDIYELVPIRSKKRSKSNGKRR